MCIVCEGGGGGGQSCATAPIFALLLLPNNSNVKVGLARETREGWWLVDTGGGSEEEGVSQLVADLKGHNVEEASVGWAIPWYIIKCGR